MSTTTTEVRSAYYNRGSLARTDTFEVLCLAHGDARWGDPFDGDGDAAFNARCSDTSGDWCWAPNVNAPCMECEGRQGVSA